MGQLRQALAPQNFRSWPKGLKCCKWAQISPKFKCDTKSQVEFDFILTHGFTSTILQC